MLLEKINSPADIKKFSQDEITRLCAECRRTIIDVVAKNGGHLASNLGVVELTVALHRVFESPRDAIIWDVSHQCYTHKLLTGRYKEFQTLRTRDGLSGFTSPSESPHDFFISGHSSTSISAAMGLLQARTMRGESGKVIAVIGDGALTGGMAFEALSNAGQMKQNLIVVLNDNQMSIDHNTGALSRYLSRMTASIKYQSLRNFIDRIVSHIPFFNRALEKIIFRCKRAIKGLFFANNLFVDLGFEYTGPIDGHNEKELEQIFKRVSRLHRPVVVHVITKKGKGYSPAENKPDVFHGIGPFQTSDGTVEKFDTTSFTEAFSNIIVEAASKNRRIAAITAAMAKGTGLTAFSHRFSERFFDVGIAEEHAVTFAGGLAKGGMIPVVCIYSTFIQRAVDQIIHDVSLQNAHVIFMLDRAGAVPSDGVTHQGVFDIALFRSVPNLQILSPCSEQDLKLCFDYAVRGEGAFVIRYPKLSCPTEIEEFSVPVEQGKGIFIPASEIIIENISERELNARKNKVLVVSSGGMYPEVHKAVRSVILQNGYADIYITRFIKPFDVEGFVKLASEYKGIVFVEDGVQTGGFSEYLSSKLYKNNIKNLKILAFDDKFYKHGNRSDVLEMAGLSVKDIEDAIFSVMVYNS